MPFIVDWYPDYWNQQEKEELFTFWRSKYHYNKVKMALSSENSGGDGFFDAELVSFANISERSVVDELHPVNIFFENRKKELTAEINNCQEEDQFRIALLMQAEKTGYDYWQYKNIYNINTSYPNYVKQIIQNKIENLLALFKDALAQLIEYDRENYHPLTDPDRDLEKLPPSVFEYRRWLTRGNRIVDVYSEEEKELKKLWSETHNKDLPVYKESFLPSYLEVKHKINREADTKKGLERNRSGLIVKAGTEVNDKPPVPLVLSRLSSLADSVNNFKIVQEDIRPEIEEITLTPQDYEPFFLDNIEKAPVPESNPYPAIDNDVFNGLRNDDEFDFEEQEEKIKKKINAILDKALNTDVYSKKTEETSYLHTDENYQNNYSEKEVYEIDNSESTITYISEDSEGESEDTSKKGDSNAPEWMKKRNFDGSNPEWFIKDDFEREKAITLLSSKMELSEKIKMQTRRSLRNTSNIWKATTETVLDFKGKALSLWKRKVAPSLGLETPERRAIAKIQKQELKHLQRTINKVKRQYKLQEQKRMEPPKPRGAF